MEVGFRRRNNFFDTRGMKNFRDKIKPLTELVTIRQEARKAGKIVVFTNGVFDILHRGHVEYLAAARRLGDLLIVGLNSDTSVRKIKPQGRPIVPEEDRAIILAALQPVDYLCLFEEETPARLIETLIPDILVKGGDYRPQEIVGREIVEAHGGKVLTIPLIPGRSTTSIVERIVELVKKGLIT